MNQKEIAPKIENPKIIEKEESGAIDPNMLSNYQESGSLYAAAGRAKKINFREQGIIFKSNKPNFNQNPQQIQSNPSHTNNKPIIAMKSKPIPKKLNTFDDTFPSLGK